MAAGLEVEFHNVCVQVDNKPLLTEVYGAVKPGQIMAIMGPSGAGKTTLLSCLSGRLEATAGEITVGGQLMNKCLRRKICYVLQHDVFFPNLTLGETLKFATLIQLPDTMPMRVKMEKLELLVDELGLRACLCNPMGGFWMPGLSGGERKRASIVCGLVTDPDIILLDEPTSGLDYKTAINLIHTLKRYASQHGKTVVSSVHQPSSQMFLLFDQLLLMCNGHSLYYGPPRDVPQFFCMAGYPMTSHYNPADFMLEKLKESEEVKQKLIQTSLATREVKVLADAREDALNHDNSSSVRRSWNRLLWKPVVIENRSYKGTDDTCAHLMDDDVEKSQISQDPPWTTGFLTQYTCLTRRAFMLSKSRLTDKFKIFENVFLCVLLCLIWFQLPRSEDTLRDRMGLIFYISMHWGFTPLFMAVTSFPAEKDVIRKERSSGWYRLSAYYLAKMSSEIPTLLFESFMFLGIVYLVTGFNTASSFFASIGTIFLHAIVGQSIGLCIGIFAMDFSRGISLATIIIMFIMLSGGFYARHLPFWLDWIKYLAFLHYTFHCLMYLEFADGKDIMCSKVTNSHVSKYSSCHHHGNQSSINGTHLSPTIPSQEVLVHYGIDQPFWFYFLPLLAFLVLFRSLGYVLLRFYQKTH